jgi:ELWxxDGT repeat protein
MFGEWSRRLLGRSVARWLSAGRKRPRRPAPVRPGVEVLESRQLLSALPVLVDDINPGSGSSVQGGYLYHGNNFNPTNVNGTLFFAATDGTHGFQLWKSNGTSSGTAMLTDIRPNYGGVGFLGGSDPSKDFTNVNGTLFFGANDGSHGYELWKSDGTSTGTGLVKDIFPGSGGSQPHYLTNVSGTLFFTAGTPSIGDHYLWRSDGTSSGTVLVADTQLPAYNLTNVNGMLFFDVRFNGGSGGSVWKTNGTSSGTVFVSNCGNSASDLFDPVNINGTLFFSASTRYGEGLWKSDGTNAGTVLVRTTDPNGASHPNDLTNVNGTVFFTANDGSHGTELWKSDGTSAGSFMVKDVNPGSSYGLPSGGANLTNVSGTLFFAANDGSHGFEVWKSDGTSSGTAMVKDVHPGSNNAFHYDGLGNLFGAMQNVNGTLFFTAASAESGSPFYRNYELWKSNGTSAGTAMVSDINPGPRSAFYFYIVSYSFANMGGTLFFTADDGSHGYELWALPPNGPTSAPTLSGLSESTAVEGSGTFTLTLTGNNFDSTAFVQWNGTRLTTDLNSATQIQALVPNSLLEEGTATVTIKQDTGTSNGLPFTITDATLFNLGLNDPGGEVEGKSTGTFTLATFTDANTGAPAKDFTATITWGDGTTSTVSGASGGIVALGGGNFAVRASHTYAEEGSYLQTVHIFDDGGASVAGSQATSIGVADAPLSGLVLSKPSATEAAGTGTFTIATFTDKNTGAPATDFTEVVQWGDGSSSTVSGSGIVSLGGGKFAVLSSHTYSEEGSYTLAVQVLDEGGASVSGSLKVGVADAPLSGLTISALQATEGKSIGTIRLATFHDINLAAAASDFTATITWGDGTTSTVSGATGSIVALGNGNFAITAGHTYAEEGSFTLSVQVRDDGGSSTSATRGLSVADAGLSSLGLLNPHATEGKGTGTFTVATFADRNSAAAATDFTAVVQWGDGSSSTVTSAGIVALGGGKFAVRAGHTYAESGSFALSVQVRDDGGASISGTLTLSVADAALASLSVQNPHATAGQDTGTFTVATFHDNNLAAPASDFTAVIHWGDGTTSTLTAADFVSQGNGNFAVLADHLYTTSGTFTMSVLVDDVGGASISGNLKIAVS